MNLLPGAEIWCLFSFLERVRIIEDFLKGNVQEDFVDT